jgi:PAS domain-containing protein
VSVPAPLRAEPRGSTLHRLPAARAPEADALAALIDALPDAVWLVDTMHLRVLVANAAAARLLGVPASELCGRSVL